MGKHSTLSRMLMLLMLLFGGTQLTPVLADDFNSTRTDFRDESIYFVITTRFYDGDPSNNVLCWDNQQAQIASKDPCWRGDFKGLIDKLDYIKALGFTAIWITPVVQNASGYDYHGYHAMDFSSVPSLREPKEVGSFAGRHLPEPYRCRSRQRAEDNPRHSAPAHGQLRRKLLLQAL